MPINAAKTPLYESFVMLHPSGVMMCRCAHEKAMWYISRNLAQWIDEKTFQLTFTPQGTGKSKDAYYLQGIPNRCVVCGATENLNKHHVLPRVFRVHCPDDYKNHTSHDVLPLCITCHDQYEKSATVLKSQLALEYGVLIQQERLQDAELARIKKVLSARKILTEHGDKIPLDRRTILAQLANQSVPDKFKQAPIRDYGAAVVKQVMQRGELFLFLQKWRSHFLQTMQPRFMPALWSVDRNEVSL